MHRFIAGTSLPLALHLYIRGITFIYINICPFGSSVRTVIVTQEPNYNYSKTKNMTDGLTIRLLQI